MFSIASVSSRVAIVLLATVAVVATVMTTLHSHGGTQFESLQGFVFPSFRFRPMRMNDGSSHDRMNMMPGFHMVSSSRGFNFGGGKPHVIEESIVEEPGPNGTTIEKKTEYDNRGGSSGSSGSSSSGSNGGNVQIITLTAPPTKKLTKEQKAKLKKEEVKEEKHEEKQEKRMAQGMANMARSIFSNFFGRGGPGGGEQGHIIVIPRSEVVGKMRPRRDWQTTKSRTSSSRAHKSPKPARRPAPKPAPRPAPKPQPVAKPKPPKGPVVNHGVVNGLAADNAFLQKLATVVATDGEP